MADGVIFPAGWKQLYQTSLFETDPEKIPERIVDARNAVLDRIEDLLNSSSSAERQALNDAFRVFGSLQNELRRHPKPQSTRPPRKMQFVGNGLGVTNKTVTQVA